MTAFVTLSFGPLAYEYYGIWIYQHLYCTIYERWVPCSSSSFPDLGLATGGSPALTPGWPWRASHLDRWGYPNSWMVYRGNPIYKWMMVIGVPLWLKKPPFDRCDYGVGGGYALSPDTPVTDVEHASGEHCDCDDKVWSGEPHGPWYCSLPWCMVMFTRCPNHWAEVRRIDFESRVAVHPGPCWYVRFKHSILIQLFPGICLCVFVASPCLATKPEVLHTHQVICNTVFRDGAKPWQLGFPSWAVWQVARNVYSHTSTLWMCAEFDCVWLLLCAKEDSLGYIGHDWAALSFPNVCLHFNFVAYLELKNALASAGDTKAASAHWPWWPAHGG